MHLVWDQGVVGSNPTAPTIYSDGRDKDTALSGFFISLVRAHHMMVDVAQLVEPRIVIPVVVGSSPIIHPNFKELKNGA